MVRQSKDLTGNRFGRLRVLERGTKSEQGHYLWTCSCDCGSSVQVWGTNLTSGKTKSCGCLVSATNTKHGESGTLMYHRWANMKSRCHNPNNRDYKDYGARGITVCDEWMEDYLQFKKDMGKIPSIYHTVERKDNDIGYTPNNCKWATRLEQSKNRGKRNGRSTKE
jgi:hypothetical protein